MIPFIIIGVLIILSAIPELIAGILNPFTIVTAIFSVIFDLIIGGMFIYAGVCFGKVKNHSKRIENLEKEIADLKSGKKASSIKEEKATIPTPSVDEVKVDNPAPFIKEDKPYSPTPAFVQATPKAKYSSQAQPCADGSILLKDAYPGVVYETTEPFIISELVSPLLIGTLIVVESIEGDNVNVSIKQPSADWVQMKIEMSIIGNANVKRVNEALL